MFSYNKDKIPAILQEKIEAAQILNAYLLGLSRSAEYMTEVQDEVYWSINYASGVLNDVIREEIKSCEQTQVTYKS